MKNIFGAYVKQATSTLKGIDLDQLADLVERTGLPIEIRRARPSLFKRVLKYGLPILGLMVVGGIVLYRQLVVGNSCCEVEDGSDKPEDVQSEVVQNDAAEVAENASSWTPGVDGNAKEAGNS